MTRIRGMMNRRTALLGILSFMASEASARGTFCSRHRAYCEERRKRERAASEEEAKRRASLTPLEQCTEDVTYLGDRLSAETAEKVKELQLMARRYSRERQYWIFACIGSAVGTAFIFAMASFEKDKP